MNANSSRRPGTPRIDHDGAVIYKVYRGRKKFGLSFLNKIFDGWAEDGKWVEGSAIFPHKKEKPIHFRIRFSSGRELNFLPSSDISLAYQECKIGDEIRFIFNEYPRPPSRRDKLLPDTEGTPYKK